MMMGLVGVLLGIIPAIFVGMAFSGPIGFLSFLLFGPLIGTALSIYYSRVDARRAGAKRRELRDAAKRLVSGLSRASDVEEGMVRLRGRVHVLRGVQDPTDGELIAAVVYRDGSRVCGRFEVVGDRMVGIVDDDMIELWDDLEWCIKLRDGDEVEVAGDTKHASDSQEGYRAAALRLMFDGRPGRPIHVFRLRDESES